MVIKVLKSTGMGILVIILNMAVIFAISAIFGDPADPSSAGMTENYATGALLAAILMPVITFLLILPFKIRTTRSILPHAAFWTLLLIIIYILIGIGNQTAGLIFGSYATYIMFLTTFGGPFIKLLTRKKQDIC